MKKAITLLSIGVLISCNLSAQIFTAVTSGEIYNDSLSLGAAWGDFDNDGDLDLFASQRQLYFNNGDGTFTKVTSGDVVDSGTGIGGTVGDYDNDGFLDIYTASPTSMFRGSLFHNNGDNTFSKILEEPFLSDTSDFQASSWVDIENDGDLDLFVTAGGNLGFQNNFLYINNGDGTFNRDSTSILTQDSTGSVHCSWSDFNNDGYSDLLISNGQIGIDSLVNNLYVNNGDGSFSLINGGTISSDQFGSLGSSWGDYDNDGFMDVFVAGNDENKLYKNNGDNTFTSINAGALVTDPDLTAGSAWEDFDNDGDIDLVFTNIGSNNALFENNGDGSFTKILGEELSNHWSFGVTWADWDKDGDQDLLFTRSGSSNHLPYLNNGNSNNWINIHCTGVLSNTAAIGAKVRVKAIINGNEVWQVREISGQTGVLGQSSLNTHFGLGTAEMIDSISIQWPSGIIQNLTNVLVNDHIEILEDISLPVQEFDHYTGINNVLVFPNPADAFANIQFELNRPAFINVSIINIAGERVMNLKQENFFEGLNSLSFDSKHLPNGMYNCRLILDGNFVINRKFAIQR